MVNFHLFSLDFLLLKAMFYYFFILFSFYFYGNGWIEFGYIVLGVNGG